MAIGLSVLALALALLTYSTNAFFQKATLIVSTKTTYDYDGFFASSSSSHYKNNKSDDNKCNPSYCFIKRYGLCMWAYWAPLPLRCIFLRRKRIYLPWTCSLLVPQRRRGMNEWIVWFDLIWFDLIWSPQINWLRKLLLSCRAGEYIKTLRFKKLL